MSQPEFLKKPMNEMTTQEWESICDGCGLCCQIRVEDADTGQIVVSNVSCKYLCLKSHSCTDYKNRQKNVPDCVKITPDNVYDLYWMPHSCGYRLVAEGKNLPEWHHLICGDRNKVHEEGPSMIGGLISEEDTDWEADFE